MGYVDKGLWRSTGHGNKGSDEIAGKRTKNKEHRRYRWIGDK